jgi:cytoplasmic iron level regulating protein YaaA (DUF328/UPF0246 family)
MLIVISPAKSIDVDVQVPEMEFSEISFPKEASSLVSKLKKKNPSQLADLLKVSPALSELNVNRFQRWEFPFVGEDAKPSLMVFKGDVFQGMDVPSFDVADLQYTQDHLLILSGLYGVLKPLDVILPYRLEMGTKWAFNKNKNLYDFWGNKIHNKVQQELDSQCDDVLINLASNEYFKAVKSKNLKARIITPEFKEYKDGKYKMISFFAKKARGMMSAYILKNKIGNPDEIKLFAEDGYLYNEQLSEGDKWVFTRS